MPVKVRTSVDDAAWQEFVLAHPGARVEHDLAWRDVFARTYGYEPCYLVASEAAELVGVMPLFSAPVFGAGRCLISVPFLDCGGPLARSPAARAALLESAREVAETRGARYLEIRSFATDSDGTPTRVDKAKVVLDLPAEEKILWNEIGGFVRNRIRKATKNGLRVVTDLGERLDAFYSVYARNMRDLGSPVVPRRLFPIVFECFGDRAKLLTVWLGDTVVAGAILLHCYGIAYVPWVSAIRPYFHLAPNNLLYWEAMQLASAAGCREFDFGRSTIGSGPYIFKLRWGARPIQLQWHYHSLAGGRAPSRVTDSRLLRIASRVWMRLPLVVTNFIGPKLVARMP